MRLMFTGAFALVLYVGLAVATSEIEQVVFQAPFDFGQELNHTVPFTISLFSVFNNTDDFVDYIPSVDAKVHGVELIPALPERSHLELAVNPTHLNYTNHTTFSLTDAVICKGNLTALGVWANATSGTTLCSTDTAAFFSVVLISSGAVTLNTECESQLHEACPTTCVANTTHNNINTTLCESTSLLHLLALFEKAINASNPNKTLSVDSATGEYDFFLLHTRYSLAYNGHVEHVYTGGTIFDISPIPTPEPVSSSSSTSKNSLAIGLGVGFGAAALLLLLALLANASLAAGAGSGLLGYSPVSST